MKYLISIIVIVCTVSLMGMQKPQGKRTATQALSETRELEKKPAIEYEQSSEKLFPLEALPDELLYEIVKALTKNPRGATKRARLDNAAEDVRAFFRTNIRFKSFENDQTLINYIITELANRYVDGDNIAAAIALGTESARVWLLNYFTGPSITDVVKYQRMNGLYANFREAIRHNRLNVIKFLLSIYEPNPIWTGYVFQGLIEAVKSDNISVINTILFYPKIQPIREQLVNRLDSPDTQETLLFGAVAHASPQMVEAFINVGANVNHTNASHRTPLYQAVDNNYKAIVQQLLAAGADVNIADDVNISPLMMAIERDSLELVRVLIDAGADINHVDDEGRSALAYAQSSDHKNKNAIIKLLMDHGAI